MPCSKGMSKCRPGCLHHRLVMEYRMAREADLVRIEAETCGDETMARENGMVGITFKEWLTGSAQERQD